MDKKLKILSTNIKDLYILEPNSFKDERGVFSRVYCQKELESISNIVLNQINHSITNYKGSVRGMHFQYPPNAEEKMVKCIKGSIFDVVVDIRKNSPTFLQIYTVKLSEKNQKMIYIPRGFAHGFQTLEDDTELLYFHSSFYTPENEGALNVKDPFLNIEWPLEIRNISQRDIEHEFLNENFEGIEIDEM